MAQDGAVNACQRRLVPFERDEASAELVEHCIRDGTRPARDILSGITNELRLARVWLIAHMTPFEPSIPESLVQTDSDRMPLEELRNALRSTAIEVREVNKLHRQRWLQLRAPRHL
jgi:hypothetical protein